MTIARPRTEAPRRRPPSPRLGRVGVRSGRAAFLALGPTSWYDARDLTGTTTQTLANRVGAGSAQLGSTSGSDTNDPVALPYDGTAYVYIPAVASNSLQIPDAPNLDLAGDFELVVRAALNNWAITNASLVLKGSAGAYGLYVGQSTGTKLRGFVNGTLVNSTASPSFTDGVAYWMKMTRRASDGRVQFFTAADQATEPTSWTQLGADVTGPTGALTANASVLRMGANGTTSEQIGGNLYRVIVRDGIDGTTVADVNPTTETLNQASWTCTTGQTVTVNRSTSGLTTAIVERPLLMADGSDDYVQLPAGDTPTFTATTGAYTVMLINRVHNLAGAATISRVWSSESASSVGAHLYLDQTNAVYKALVGGASSVTAAAAAFTQTTQLHAAAVVFGTGNVYTYSTTTGLTAGTSYAGVGTITHTTPRVAARGVSPVAGPADLETYAVVHWTRALTATELDTAATYLLGSYV